MRSISLRNKTILKILNDFKDYILDESLSYILNEEKSYKSYRKPFEKTITEEYLNHIRKDPNKHEGYPECLRGVELKNDVPLSEVFSLNNNEEIKDQLNSIIEKSTHVCSELNKFIASRNNALCAYYPEDGFIGWHNNQNAPGNNILFSYSETGTGWFEYLDLKTNKTVKMPDQKGVWTCKVGYYGTYEEEDKVFWHKAESNGGRRITVAFMCPDEMMWNMAIEDIETP